MEVTDIKTRIGEISERLVEIGREQSQSGLDLARAQGSDEMLGIHIEPLTDWARRMRVLNSEAEALVEERKRLRTEKREARVCSCDCH